MNAMSHGRLMQKGETPTCFYKRWTNTTKMFGKDDFDVQKTIYKGAAAVRKRKKHAALEQTS